jgi:hypothetical protein
MGKQVINVEEAAGKQPAHPKSKLNRFEKLQKHSQNNEQQ